MSIETFSRVWDLSPQDGTALLIMLTLADNANPFDGTGFVSRATIANRARISEDEVETWLTLLETQREIVRKGGENYQLAQIYWETAKESESAPAKKPAAGFVYVLRAASGEYKIGLTRDPASRMATFGLTLPFRVKYELLISSDDMRSLEKELHARFAHKRLDGEWFALTDNDLAEIRTEYGGVQ